MGEPWPHLTPLHWRKARSTPPLMGRWKPPLMAPSTPLLMAWPMPQSRLPLMAQSNSYRYRLSASSLSCHRH